jgi:hypothetical protein
LYSPGEIDDRETSEAEAKVGFAIHPVIVGATMGKGPGHPTESFTVRDRGV